MRFAVFLLILLLQFALPARKLWANGDLMVTPTRLVFDGRERSAEVGLINTGKETAVYRITLINKRMTREGTFEEVAADALSADEALANSMIRYYPRQVELKPGESQTVRVQVRKPARLAEGEFRTHLQFRGVPAAASDAAAKPAEGGLQIELRAIYGVSIPVIIREGKTSAKAELERPKLVPAPDRKSYLLQIVLQRSGNESVYGTLKVTFTGADSKEQEVALFKGIAVYTPNSERLITVPWTLPISDLSSGTIQASFFDAATEKLLAQSEVRFR